MRSTSATSASAAVRKSPAASRRLSSATSSRSRALTALSAPVVSAVVLMPILTVLSFAMVR